MASELGEAGPATRTGRLERLVLGPGDEPDPRFSLANERTFLAWIRTSLTLLAGGVAVEAFAGESLSFAARRALALGMVCLGMAFAVGSCYRWVTLERAMRRREPLPLNPLALALVLGVALAALMLAVSIMLHG